MPAIILPPLPSAKVCRQCRKSLPPRVFNQFAGTADALPPVCRACRRENHDALATDLLDCVSRGSRLAHGLLGFLQAVDPQTALVYKHYLKLHRRAPTRGAEVLHFNTFHDVAQKFKLSRRRAYDTLCRAEDIFLCYLAHESAADVKQRVEDAMRAANWWEPLRYRARRAAWPAKARKGRVGQGRLPTPQVGSLARRIRVKNAKGRYTRAEWYALCERYDYHCLCCARQFWSLAADHVIPLARGGRNDIFNIQPLCGLCNSKKGTKDTDYRPLWRAVCGQVG